MNATLIKKLYIWQMISATLAAVIIILSLQLYWTEEEHQRLHDAEIFYMQQAKDRRIDLNHLCQVNRTLEAILSVEIPQWEGDWGPRMTEACK